MAESTSFSSPPNYVRDVRRHPVYARFTFGLGCARSELRTVGWALCIVSKKPQDVLAAIDAANPAESRSSLARFMRQHHDALLARFGDHRPDWKVLAEVFAQAGLRDRLGKPASPDTVRVAWARVRKTVAEAKAKKRRAKSPVAPILPSEPADQQTARVNRLFEPAEQEKRPAPSAPVKPPAPLVAPESDDDDDFIKPMGGPKVWKKD